MSDQLEEILVIKDEVYGFRRSILHPILEEREVKFKCNSTGIWRGYLGTWELIDNKIYLIDLNAYIDDEEIDGIEYLFPGEEKVFAEWVNAKIPLDIGGVLFWEFYHKAIYEKELVLEFKDGVLIGETEVDNRKVYDRKLWDPYYTD